APIRPLASNCTSVTASRVVGNAGLGAAGATAKTARTSASVIAGGLAASLRCAASVSRANKRGKSPLMAQATSSRTVAVAAVAVAASAGSPTGTLTDVACRNRNRTCAHIGGVRVRQGLGSQNQTGRPARTGKVHQIRAAKLGSEDDGAAP